MPHQVDINANTDKCKFIFVFVLTVIEMMAENTFGKKIVLPLILEYYNYKFLIWSKTKQSKVCFK